MVEMKKRIFVFICIFAVLLNACGKKQTEDYEMSKDIAVPTDGMAATTENEVVETVPKDSCSESEKILARFIATNIINFHLMCRQLHLKINCITLYTILRNIWFHCCN